MTLSPGDRGRFRAPRAAAPESALPPAGAGTDRTSDGAAAGDPARTRRPAAARAPRGPASPLILAVDQSTSATKAMAFDAGARIVARASVDHRQIYPRPGWVEHDPEELYANTIHAIRSVVEELGSAAERLGVLAITNQRETVVVWSRETGRPIANAVVWQCGRGAELCRRLAEAGHEGTIRARSGLRIDPSFSASKISWILENVAGAAAEARRGALAFGTVDTWLIYRLTRGQVHATDLSNASRTLLLNLTALAWDDELFALFGIPRSMAPQLARADDPFGTTTAEGALPRELPIRGVLGDSHAALFAQRCLRPGEAKATYGTGSSIMMNVGSTRPPTARSVVASVGFALRGRADYVLEGNIVSSGDTIRWLVDGLGLLPDSASSEAVAESVVDSGGVHLVPAFSGMGAPYWDAGARGSILGLTRGSTKAHLVRAALESIAFQVADLVSAMEADSGVRLATLRVDGGATRNQLLMQMQADILGVPVVRAGLAEASALGAALAAGLSIGLYRDLRAIEALPAESTTFEPRMNEERRSALLEGWHEAVRRTLSRGGGA